MLLPARGGEERETWRNEIHTAGLEITKETIKELPGHYSTIVFHIRKPARSE